ncbi:MAG: hypothetical protein IIC22_06625, partial [Chloroflexi bacterium]|nr:hypothetical protein [Chloroflexota bacterium]
MKPQNVAFIIDPDKPDEIEEAKRLNERLIMRALAMDGTCTGASLACNDDAAGTTSSITLTVTAGQLVILVVDGKGVASGPYNLSV